MVTIEVKAPHHTRISAFEVDGPANEVVSIVMSTLERTNWAILRAKPHRLPGLIRNITQNLPIDQPVADVRIRVDLVRCTARATCNGKRISYYNNDLAR